VRRGLSDAQFEAFALQLELREVVFAHERKDFFDLVECHLLRQNLTAAVNQHAMASTNAANT
jgi:hypothetical protein